MQCVQEFIYYRRSLSDNKLYSHVYSLHWKPQNTSCFTSLYFLFRVRRPKGDKMLQLRRKKSFCSHIRRQIIVKVEARDTVTHVVQFFGTNTFSTGDLRTRFHRYYESSVKLTSGLGKHLPLMLRSTELNTY